MVGYFSGFYKNRPPTITKLTAEEYVIFFGMSYKILFTGRLETIST